MVRIGLMLEQRSLKFRTKKSLLILIRRLLKNVEYLFKE